MQKHNPLEFDWSSALKLSDKEFCEKYKVDYEEYLLDYKPELEFKM